MDNVNYYLSILLYKVHYFFYFCILIVFVLECTCCHDILMSFGDKKSYLSSAI